MATVKLTPSTIYNAAGTNYLTVTSASNAYTDTDSTTRATITNTSASTSNRYIYLRGFNFNSVPTNATVNSYTVKLKAYQSGGSTSTSYRPYLCNNTTTYSNAYSDAITTTSQVLTFNNGGTTWDSIKNSGSNFGIRINCRRNSRNTQAVFYIYGAEINVDYSTATPTTVTSTLTGNGTISPSGAYSTYTDSEYTLTITPTNSADEVTVTNNGTDVTSELEAHYTGGAATSSTQTAGSGVTTGFNRSGSAFYQSSNTQSDSWLRYAIGKSAESPYSTSNTSNTYVKDGTNDANTMGWMNYPFDFSSLPADAEVTSIEVKCYGATESTTETARHADIALYSGNELKSVSQSFTSTSNSTITINNPGTWTREELQDAWLRFTVGYYGGRLLGITWKVNYTSGGTLHHYTYTYTVTGDATIAVTIGSTTPTEIMYIKVNNSWVAASKVYKKISGSWVEQTDLTAVFESGVNYKYNG